MRNFFEKNITALKRQLANTEVQNHLASTIKVLTTPSGDISARYESVLLHSSYDPFKEARVLAKNVKPRGRIFLYGLGLGYHVEAILDEIGLDGQLIIIELNPDILSAALILRDLSKLILDPRTFWVYGSNEVKVAELMAHHMDSAQAGAKSGNLDVIFHSPSLKCIPQKFERITNALEVLQIERRVPAIFGSLEAKNRELNEDIIRKSQGLISLRGKNRDKPAFMISAGPSLDDALPFLHLILEKAIVACVDTAYSALLDRGIYPDYVFSLDPQDESFNFFRRYLDKNLNLVFTPTSNAKVVRFVTGKKIVAFKEGKVSAQDKELADRKGMTKAGGSVSCFGVDSLIQMACNPIILVGQDCAFTGHRTYSRSTWNEEQLSLLVCPAFTPAQAHWEKYAGKKLIPVPCYGTGMTNTNQILYSYLRNMEQLAEANPETRIYNLFPHGAKIDNIEPLRSINETLRILRRTTL